MSPHDQATVSTLLQAGDLQHEDKVQPCSEVPDDEVVVVDIVQVLVLGTCFLYSRYIRRALPNFYYLGFLNELLGV